MKKKDIKKDKFELIEIKGMPGVYTSTMPRPEFNYEKQIHEINRILTKLIKEKRI